MCSGLRSSSAKGAIALRQASACSWSTSSSSVLSDWTIRGPSFITEQLYGPARTSPSSLRGLEHQVTRPRAQVTQAGDEQLRERGGRGEGDVHVEVGGDALELPGVLVRASPAQRVQPLDRGVAHLPAAAEGGGADALGGEQV